MTSPTTEEFVDIVPVHDPRREPVRFANWGRVQVQDSVVVLTLGAVTAADHHREGASHDVDLEIVGRFAIPPGQLAELASVMLEVAASAESLVPRDEQASAVDT